MHRPGGAHPLVEGVRILQGLVAEERAGIGNGGCHVFSVSGGFPHVNDAAES
jgi:hypothetical protein